MAAGDDDKNANKHNVEDDKQTSKKSEDIDPTDYSNPHDS